MSKCILKIQGYGRILFSSVVMVIDFCSCVLGLNPAHLIICQFVTDLDRKKIFVPKTVILKLPFFEELVKVSFNPHSKIRVNAFVK